MSSCLRILIPTLSLLTLASSSQAVTIAIGASDSGWHSSSGNHTATNQNYAAGWTNEELRNFFVFDLSSLPPDETILSITFRAYNPAAGEPDATYTGGFDSPDPTETYELREVLLPAAIVTAPTISNTAVFDDLGDGSLFGSHLASSADNGSFIEIGLDAAGISSAQTFAGIGEFVLGGLVSSLTASFGSEEIVFGDTDPPGFGPYTRELIITITPEPGTGALLALGLVGIAARRRGRA